MENKKTNKIKVKSNLSNFYKAESNHTIQKIVIRIIQNEIESRLIL